MKLLQDEHLKSYLLDSTISIEGYESKPEHPEQVILLLHGLGERGKRIYRKLISSLPVNAIVLAPNAPFPLSRDGQMEGVPTYAWYFYDLKARKYITGVDLAKSSLKSLLRPYSHLPLTIIGFSQGGYLASGLLHDFPQLKRIVGIGCEFKREILREFRSVELVSIHGKNDSIISYETALTSFQSTKELFPKAKWIEVENLAHEINDDVSGIVRSLFEVQ